MKSIVEICNPRLYKVISQNVFIKFNLTSEKKPTIAF